MCPLWALCAFCAANSCIGVTERLLLRALLALETKPLLAVAERAAELYVRGLRKNEVIRRWLAPGVLRLDLVFRGDFFLGDFLRGDFFLRGAICFVFFCSLLTQIQTRRRVPFREQNTCSTIHNGIPLQTLQRRPSGRCHQSNWDYFWSSAVWPHFYAYPYF